MDVDGVAGIDDLLAAEDVGWAFQEAAQDGEFDAGQGDFERVECRKASRRVDRNMTGKGTDQKLFLLPLTGRARERLQRRRGPKAEWQLPGERAQKLPLLIQSDLGNVAGVASSRRS